MILNVDIEKEAPGCYSTRAKIGGVQVTQSVAYDCIETAIRAQALNIPDDFVHFVEFTYGGMSTGTCLVNQVPVIAGALADRLIALIAEEHRIHDQI